MKRKRVRLLQLRFAAYMEQNGLCYYCKKPMQWTVGANTKPSCTAEHLVDRKHKGKDSQENIVAAHFQCNSIKGKARIRSRKH